MTNEEALELLKDTNLILRCSFTGDIRIVEAIDMAIKALGKDTNVPTKWIPVSERLPERGGHYLVTEKISEECWFVGIAPYRSTCERWFGDNEVTAWMPLPEPWKGE